MLTPNQKPKEKTMSIRVTINCQIEADKYQELVPFLETNLSNVRGFKGNRRVSVLFNPNKTEMLLDEEWLSQESHQAYLEFIENNGVLEQLGSFLNSPPQIKYFQMADI